MKTALFVAIPFAGHINPLLQQAKELKRRGWNVELASLESARSRVEGSGVTFVSLGSPADSQDIFDAIIEAGRDQKFFFSSLKTMRGINRLWPAMYDGLKHKLQQERPDVLVVDFASLAGIDAAPDIPIVINNPDLLTMLPGELIPFDPRLPLPFQRSSIRNLPLWQPVQARIMMALGMRVSHLAWMWDINVKREKKGLKRVRFADLLRGKPILINSAFGLEYKRELPPDLHMVGPMLQERSDVTPESIPQPTVYVNMGTICQLSRKQLQRMLEAFTCDDFHVLWILRKEQRDLLPPSIPKTIRIESWGPSPQSILEHPNVVAFVSHCGVNSVHESIQAGTPIVGIPMFADQRDMAYRVQDSGAGLFVHKERFTAAELRTCIQRVIREEQFARALPPLQASFREAGGIPRAADVIEKAAAFDYSRQVC
jgi:UDP:flavonoid glycosyltransferase YjiC (YdhE family)